MTTTKQVANAQRTRRQIARTFKLMQRDDFNVSDFLNELPAISCLQRVRVYDVVRRLPHMGSDGAEKVLHKSNVWPLTRCGDLTVKDVDEILGKLPPRARGTY